MNYQVLARKWRPQNFIDVIGQEHILIAITNSLSLNRIHHSYLLSGIHGIGKTTLARLFAKGLSCKVGITAIPCRKCNNCLEIEQGCFIDLIEIDAASRTKVEDTRELLDNMQYAPVVGRFKIYIIDEVHMLSRHSFNALLKTLEEPPRHIKIFLATTEPQKLPLTILSRCLHFHLKALSIEQIQNKLSVILQHELIEYDYTALRLLAHAATGSMRDALSLTDQAIAIEPNKVSINTVKMMLGIINTGQPLALIETFSSKDSKAMMTLLEQCASLGIDWDDLLMNILSLLHHIAIDQLLPKYINHKIEPNDLSRLQILARNISAYDLQFYYKTILIGRKELPYAPEKRIGVEMTMLRILAFHHTQPYSNI